MLRSRSSIGVVNGYGGVPITCRAERPSRYELQSQPRATARAAAELAAVDTSTPTPGS